MGDYSAEEESLIGELKNPLKWLLNGVQIVIAIPLFLLTSLNIISSERERGIVKSFFYRLISGLIALVGFVSSVFSLIFGWDQIIIFVSNIIKY